MENIIRASRSRPWALLLLLLLAPALARAGESVDHGLYAGLLARHVADGRVDYAGLAAEEPALDAYLRRLEAVDPRGLDLDQRKALYINAYNAWTLKLVLSAYPGLASIKDLGGWFSSPWKKPLVRLEGRVLSLDELEHGILRQAPFKDPRIHFALNCASRSCPPLRPEPYMGERLEEQLDHAARSFLDNTANTRVEGETLWLSRIFEWYREDFGPDPGAFVRPYLDGDLAARLDAIAGRVRIRFLDYDWGLNSR